MSKSIKLKDNTYWDSTAVVHNKEPLSSIIIALQDATADEGWKDLTVTNATAGNSSNLGYQGVRYRKIGDIVFFEAGITVAYSGSSITIATFPSDCRPSYQYYYFGQTSGKRIDRWYIKNGNLVLEWSNTMSTGENYTTEQWHTVMGWFVL